MSTDERLYPQGSVIELYGEVPDGSLPEIFTLLECIGSGASCVAYRAETGQGVPVKLKQFRPRDLDPDSERFRLAEERFLMACRQQRSMLSDRRLSNITSGLFSVFRDADGFPWSAVSNMEGVTLDELLLRKGLHDNLRILLAMAESVEAYHEAGWLLLDIKPENVLVVDGPGLSGVNFFDFDSFLRIRDVEDAISRGESLLLSSTPEYSAPELRNSPVNLRDIGPAADRYSLGAILFQSVFHRVPELPDCLPGAPLPEWNLGDGLRGSLSPAVRDALTAFFRKTVTLSPSDRFRTDGELNGALRDLLELSRPSRPRLSSRIPAPGSSFRGREEETRQIGGLLRNGTGPVFLCGLGGIGKTRLALKVAETYRESLSFCYTGFRGSVRQTVLSLPMENLNRTRIGPRGEPVPIPDDELYETVMACLREGYDRNTVLIIDNFDALRDEDTCRLAEDPDFEDLCTLPLRLLFTTRCHFDGYSCVDVGPLTESDLLSLMKDCLPGGRDEELRKIIQKLGCHTLCVDIAARTLKESKGTLTPRALLEDLGKQSRLEGGTSLSESLRTVFRVSGISETSGLVLSCACLFPLHGLDSLLLRELFSDEEWGAANRLEQCGWLHFDAFTNLWSMHPLVLSVCLREKETAPSVERDKGFMSLLRSIEETDPRLRTDGELHRQVTEMFANYARMTVDPLPTSSGTPSSEAVSSSVDGMDTAHDSEVASVSSDVSGSSGDTGSGSGIRRTNDHTHHSLRRILFTVLAAVFLVSAGAVAFNPDARQTVVTYITEHILPSPSPDPSPVPSPDPSPDPAPTPTVDPPTPSPDESPASPEPSVTPTKEPPLEYPDAKLGEEALRAVRSGIEYPKTSEYFDDYRYATVVAPKGHSVYGFGSADHQGSQYTVLNGEVVQILAERKGYSCVIVLSTSKGRWVNNDYLEPLQMTPAAAD